MWEIILIGAALSADAMSVTIVNSLANPHLSPKRAFLQPLAFGVFQGIMPAAGFFFGSLIADAIERFGGFVAFVILAVIGGKMIWDAFHEDFAEEENSVRGTLTLSTILLQAVATSIDAFAVGVSFAATGENIFFCAPIIALCTFVLCLITLKIGQRFGERLGSRAQVVGGIVLILIGIKALLP